MGGCLSQQDEAPPEQIVIPKRPSQPLPDSPATPRNSKLMTMESLRPNARYINAAYWPQWIGYHERYPSTFDLTKLSHIFYAFASINPDGSIRCTDENVDIKIPVDGTTGYINAWTQMKTQYPSLKIILSIGGAGASSRRFAWVGSDTQRRERFASSAKHLLQVYNLDGVGSVPSVYLSGGRCYQLDTDSRIQIDINWDPGSAEEGQHLLELVRTIRKTFNPQSQFSPRFITTGPKHLITACLPASQLILRHIPLAAVSKELDLINLMAYDFVDSQSKQTGHHAQLSTGGDPDTYQSCEIAVNFLKANDVPPNKVLLGVPLYG
jgi:chitinase